MDNRRKILVTKDMFLKILELSIVTYEDLKTKY